MGGAQHIKKGDGILRETFEVKCNFFEKNSNKFAIENLCEILKISRSGFYAWRNRAESKREHEDKRLKLLIKTSFKRSRET